MPSSSDHSSHEEFVLYNYYILTLARLSSAGEVDAASVLTRLFCHLLDMSEPTMVDFVEDPERRADLAKQVDKCAEVHPGDNVASAAAIMCHTAMLLDMKYGRSGEAVWCWEFAEHLRGRLVLGGPA